MRAAIEDGVPDKMKSYDMFEAHVQDSSYLLACWVDYPAPRYLCIVNVYRRQLDGTWKLLTFNNFKKDLFTFAEQLAEVLIYLENEYYVWALTFIDDKRRGTFDDSEWDANSVCPKIGSMALNGHKFVSTYMNDSGEQGCADHSIEDAA